MPQLDKDFYAFGEFRLDSAEHALYHKEQLVPLTPKAIETLLVLVRRAGRVVGKEELIQAVWPDTFVEEGNLNVNIFALRKALGELSQGRSFIETVPRRGYRFVMPVQTEPCGSEALVVETVRRTHLVVEEVSAPSVETKGEAQSVPGSAGAMQLWRRGLSARQRLSIGFATVAVLSVAVAAAYLSRQQIHNLDSIAVLPFVNVGNDSKTEILADGVTENLINHLSQLPELKVVSRTSAFHYKGKEVSPRQVAQDLRVHALVMGRVVQHENQFVISVELVDAQHDRQIWGQQYVREMSNLLSFQSEIPQRVAEQLALRMTGSQKVRLANPATSSPQAYELYLRGRYFWAKRAHSDLLKAVDYFHQAIGKDPNFALAYAGIASSYDLLGEYGWSAPVDAFAHARAAAAKALELDDSLGEAHAAMGNIVMDESWDFPGAEREYRRAIELNPSFASVHQWYSELLSKRGRHDEAVVEAEKGKELDPLALQVISTLGQVYLYAGRPHAAARQAKYAIELDPSFTFAHYVLGQIFVAQGSFLQAVGEMERVVALEPQSNRYRGYLGYVYARGGETAKARSVLAELLEQSKQEYVPWAHIAIIYAGLGETDHALTALERAYELRDPDVLGVKSDPRFAGLRSEPRFEDLLRRVGI